MKTLIAILLLSSCLNAQSRKVDFAALMIDAGARGLDVYGTERMLHNGGRERVLPGVIANHAGTMVAYSATVVGLNWSVSRELKRRGHPRIAVFVPLIDAAITLPFAIQCFTIHK